MSTFWRFGSMASERARRDGSREMTMGRRVQDEAVGGRASGARWLECVLCVLWYSRSSFSSRRAGVEEEEKEAGNSECEVSTCSPCKDCLTTANAFRTLYRPGGIS